MAHALLPSLPALRQLLLERFPPAIRAVGAALATGVPVVDDATGGLPCPGITELVCSAPSCGSHLFLTAVLRTARARYLRVALIDRGDAFDPAVWPATGLDHIVWVRTRHAAESLAAADLLTRDANLGLVALDLRHAPPVELRKIPASHWYRLQRAIEPGTLACLVLTPQAVVPSARLRLRLPTAHRLIAQHEPRPQLVAALSPVFIKQRALALAAG